MKNLLTQKQETFCLKYIELGNATEAAIVAGYSSKTARFIASINLTKANIIDRIKDLRKATEDSTIADAKERRQVLTDIVRGRFGSFITEDGTVMTLTKENLKSAALQEIRIVEFTGGKDGRAREKSTTIKLHSPIQAIDLLNKMDKIYTDGAAAYIDNRTLVINVNTEKAKQLTEQIIEGKRTGEDKGQAL